MSWQDTDLEHLAGIHSQQSLIMIKLLVLFRALILRYHYE